MECFFRRQHAQATIDSFAAGAIDRACSPGIEGEISNWNTSKVTTMNYMFQNSVFRGDISKWPLDSLEEYLRVFSQWHASPLGIASYIDSRETVLGAPPTAFDELLRVTEQLGLERLDAAKHLYQMLYLEPPTLSTPSWSNFLLED